MKPKYPIAIVIMSMLCSCNGNSDRRQMQSIEDVSKQELATALNERDELLSLVKDISAGIEQIKQLENVMTVAGVPGEESAGQRKQILADISCLKENVKLHKKQLTELETRLSNSTINNRELKETIGALRTLIDTQMDEIESLRRQLTKANRQIGELNSAVDSLNLTVSTVEGQRDTAMMSSERFENELNTCYYVVAKKSDLKDHNIIESGFLRKTRLMRGDFDKDFFVTGDKKTLNRLPLNTSKVKILTNHPASSYRIIEENEHKTIEISNPEQFWSLTNYLVVQAD